MNLLRSLLVSTHIHTALISRSGWNFFSPELRRNAIPHQTHANTEVKKAIEFFINTSITKPKTKTEAKISNPNEITMLTSMCTHTSKPLKMLTNSVYLPRGQARVMGDVHTRQINLVGLNQRPEWPLVEIQGIAQAPPADRHKLCPDSGCFRVFISVPRAPIQTNQAGWVGLCAWLLWPASARHSARTAPPRTPLPSA